MTNEEKRVFLRQAIAANDALGRNDPSLSLMLLRVNLTLEGQLFALLDADLAALEGRIARLAAYANKAGV